MFKKLTLAVVLVCDSGLLMAEDAAVENKSEQAQVDTETIIVLDAVKVRAPMIDSRIFKHPATVETFDKKQIEENLNAATSSQTLKYMPSMQVRERFIGDRNGNIATRTVGSLASAQNMLYADGVLLSNFLQGNFGSPRWGLVTPEEIESISMMYGPFSALYAGNSFGGVITQVTRMPDKFEAHASAQAFTQSYKHYGTNESFNGNHLTASFGNKVNDLSFWFGVDRLDNRSQPMGFSTANRSTTAPGVSPIVTGAYQDKSEVNKDRVIFGANSIDDSEQTNIKFKVAYDITPTIKAAYTLGVWNLDSKTEVKSYVKDAAGNAVYNGQVNFNSQRYDISGMSPAEAESLHIMQALDVKSNSKDFFDWQLTLSDYDFHQDKNSFSNAPTGGTIAAGNPYLNRIGRVTDQAGTGWTVFDARTTLRPQRNYSGQHTIDIGYHVDQYELRSETNDTADWSTGVKGGLFSAARGDTRTQALYAQDKWQMNPQWALTFGGRAEHWEANDGQNKITIGGILNTANYKDVSVNKFSPKVSLSFEPQPEWGFRASFGQAFRFPTVGELFQPLQNGAVSYFVQSNPNLKPEEVIAGEFSAERRFDNGLLRASLFSENKFDALITQFLAVGSAIPYDTGTCTRSAGCSYTQNVEHIRTRGLELATQWQDVLVQGLDLLGSATFTDAEVLRNDNAPSTVGNKPTRIPRSMFKAVATYHQGSHLTYSLAARYSGRQYNALDNSDSNPDTYGAASKFFIVDVKANYKFADKLTASIGVDNLNNYKAYVFHPYPQRTGYLQLKYDY
ncbi:TonB-dependent receptor [Methylotenera sp.]|uniref:TonB-dependent receptor n=1 Tax=Methylotenera sp. TaxID=2051956 RepID=UPI002488CA02|nr:TonB-dependent receptor [Methylotenera sp.]MDI1362798.1 TonB-dependent receptor [Methylotenera sp.]